MAEKNESLSFDALRHQNYYFALEQDLIKLSRYIEFDRENFKAYSIEMAHLLFAAASEVDVILKKLCEQKTKSVKSSYRISDYRKIIPKEFPEVPLYICGIERYNLYFRPFKAWKNGEEKNPDWWLGYNKVKHNRAEEFKQANLGNTLNAMCALALLNKVLVSRDPFFLSLASLLDKEAFIRVGGNSLDIEEDIE